MATLIDDGWATEMKVHSERGERAAVWSLGLILAVTLYGCASEPPVDSGYGPPYQKPESQTAPKACIYVRCGVNPQYEYDTRYCCINGPQD
jgi:hypothetical protein